MVSFFYGQHGDFYFLSFCIFFYYTPINFPCPSHSMPASRASTAVIPALPDRFLLFIPPILFSILPDSAE